LVFLVWRGGRTIGPVRIFNNVPNHVYTAEQLCRRPRPPEKARGNPVYHVLALW
jgi:hypothetical protein